MQPENEFSLDCKKRGYIIFPDSNDIKEMHDILIDLTGGERGIQQDGNIEYLNTATEYAINSENRIQRVAAFYLYNICCGHGFVDGCKRTALGTALSFLFLNGAILKDPLSVNSTFMLDLASNKYTLKDCEKLFIENTVFFHRSDADRNATRFLMRIENITHKGLDQKKRLDFLWKLFRFIPLMDGPEYKDKLMASSAKKIAEQLKELEQPNKEETL